MNFLYLRLITFALLVVGCDRPSAGSGKDSPGGNDGLEESSKRSSMAVQPERAVETPEQPGWVGVAGRVALAPGPELRWSVQTGDRDSSALQPIAIIATDSQLLVSDYATPRIVARSARDGGIEWMAGRRGSGPNEWSGMLQFARADGNEIVVLERHLRRLTTLSAHGEFLSRKQLRAAAPPVSICINDGGVGAVGVIGPHFTLGILDRGADSVRMAQEQPWRELGTRNAVAGQFRATYLAGYGCTLVPSYVSRIMRLGDAGELKDSIRLLEEVAAPAETTSGTSKRITRSVRSGQAQAGQAVARAGNYIMVPFGGFTKWKGRLIDAFDLRSGRYAGTFVVEGRVMDIAGNRTHAFVLFEREDGEYEIAAYQVGSARGK